MFSSFRYVSQPSVPSASHIRSSDHKRRKQRAVRDTKLTAAQRNLNNCFAYDLVPSPSVITAALRAARRVNDFPSAVRVFEGTSIIYRTIRGPRGSCARSSGLPSAGTG